jgi:predicted kinase
MSEFEMFIMRGASGSGKSSKARTLDGMVLSTDDFFIDAATGEYRFNVAILAQAHCWNVARAEAAIAAKVQRIIVDNTNLEAWEAGPYVRLAQGSRYTVKIIDADSPWCRDPVELLRRQTHGVPLETLKAQLARLESYSVAQAARTPSKPSQLSPHEQKKLKASAQRSVEALIKSSNGDDSGDNDNENDGVDETTVAAPSSSSVRVEIAVNDGAKSRRKPFVIRSADFDAFLQAALASLKLKGNAPLCFDDSGRRVAAIADIVPNSLLVFSARGEPFVAALNKQRKGGVVADESSTASPAAAAASTHASAHEKAGAPWKFCKHGIHKLPLGASTIVDNFLFLGSARDAHSGQHMHELDIKHVLNVAREVPQTSVPLDAYAATPLDDDDAQSIAAALPVALRFLDSARTAKARVLVHCVIGKSRSTTIVLAFLVARCDMSLLDAWRMVRAARPVVQPNANFLRQLMRSRARGAWRTYAHVAALSRRCAAARCARRRARLAAHVWRVGAGRLGACRAGNTRLGRRSDRRAVCDCADSRRGAVVVVRHGAQALRADARASIDCFEWHATTRARRATQRRATRFPPARSLPCWRATAN